MSSGAIIMMVLTMSVVTALTNYYFIKVLRTPPKRPESDGEDQDETAGE